MIATLEPPPAPDTRGDMRTLARGGVLAIGGVVVSAVLQFALVVAVTRGLGASGAGAFLEAVALFTIIAGLAQFGANTGLVRSLPRARALGAIGELRALLAVAVGPVLIAGAAAGAALYLLAPQVAAVFFDGAHSDAAVTDIRLFAAALPLAPATIVLLAATRGLGTMAPYVAVQNLGLPALRLALVVLAVVAGLGGTAVALGWTIPVAVAFAAAVVLAIRLLRRAERQGGVPARASRAIGPVAVEFWRFSAARGLAGVLGLTVTWVDVLLVGALRSTREAGIYAAASRLSIGGAYALQAVGMAIAPRISALLARDRRERVELLYRVATWWLMVLSWPLYLVLAAFAPFVMGMFGNEFVAGQTALVILSAAMLVNLATGNVTVVLLMSGRSALNLVNAAVSLTLNVTLNVLLIPVYGMTGAALAWAVSILFINLAPLLQVWRVLGVRPPFGTGYALVALASIVCYGVLGLAVRHVFGMSAASFLIFCAVATLLYAGLLLRFRDALKLSELRDALRR